MKVQPVVILLVTCFACEEIRAGSPAQDPPEPPVRLKKKEKRSSTESDERKLEPALPKEAKPATEGADSGATCGRSAGPSIKKHADFRRTLGM